MVDKGSYCSLQRSDPGFGSGQGARVYPKPYTLKPAKGTPVAGNRQSSPGRRQLLHIRLLHFGLVALPASCHLIRAEGSRTLDPCFALLGAGTGSAPCLLPG